MKGCKYCNKKPKYSSNSYGYLFLDTDEEIARGEWAYAALYIGVDENGNLRMFASGENDSDGYYPKFCPECGRKLPKPQKAIEKNGLWIEDLDLTWEKEYIKKE